MLIFTDLLKYIVVVENNILLNQLKALPTQHQIDVFTFKKIERRTKSNLYTGFTYHYEVSINNVIICYFQFGYNRDNHDKKYISIVFHNRVFYTDNISIILSKICRYTPGTIFSFIIDLAVDTQENLLKTYQTLVYKNKRYEYKHKSKVEKKVVDDEIIHYSMLTMKFNDRYMRLYNKTAELKHSKKSYIKDLHKKKFGDKNVYRLEFSIKYAKICKLLNNKNYSLIDLVSSRELHKKVLYELISQTLSFRLIDKKDKNKNRWKQKHLIDLKRFNNNHNIVLNETFFTEKNKSISNNSIKMKFTYLLTYYKESNIHQIITDIIDEAYLINELIYLKKKIDIIYKNDAGERARLFNMIEDKVFYSENLDMFNVADDSIDKMMIDFFTF